LIEKKQIYLFRSKRFYPRAHRVCIKMTTAYHED